MWLSLWIMFKVSGRAKFNTQFFSSPSVVWRKFSDGNLMEKSDEKAPMNNGFFLNWWYFAGVHHSLSWNTFKNNLKNILCHQTKLSVTGLKYHSIIKYYSCVMHYTSLNVINFEGTHYDSKLIQGSPNPICKYNQQKHLPQRDCYTITSYIKEIQAIYFVP